MKSVLRITSSFGIVFSAILMSLSSGWVRADRPAHSDVSIEVDRESSTQKDVAEKACADFKAGVLERYAQLPTRFADVALDDLEVQISVRLEPGPVEPNHSRRWYWICRGDFLSYNAHYSFAANESKLFYSNKECTDLADQNEHSKTGLVYQEVDKGWFITDLCKVYWVELLKDSGALF